jgi:SAM-dependent methyltransferase
MSKHQQFWNKEYRTSEHLMLSDEPAEDLEKFCRFLERNYGKRFLNVTTRALDLGCGNGRNLIYLSQNYGMRGVGYDISDEGITIAKRASEGLSIVYTARSIEGVIDMPDNSVDIVLDMMTSHFLRKKEREALRAEIFRVLKPGGWLFFKSFLSEEDMHVKRLLKEHPADEPDAYIHPTMGVYEHVWNEESLHEFFAPYFSFAKIERSYKHIRDGKPWKRRTVCAYLEKPIG